MLCHAYIVLETNIPRNHETKQVISSGNTSDLYLVGVSSYQTEILNFPSLDWSVYTCLTQLYGGRGMYNLLHKDQLHVSALFIGHLQVYN